MVRTPKLHVGSVHLSDVAVTDTGSPFTIRARPGGLLLVYFGYTTCPDLCPTTMAAIRSARAELGQDAQRVDVAFITVDRTRDTPQVLRAFVGKFVSGAHLLRPANAAQLAVAQRAFLVTANEQPGGSIDHSSTVAAIDASGTVLLEWPFGISAAAMTHDLRVLLKQVAT